MIKKGWISFLGFILFFSGCTSIDVRIDYDPEHNFSGYETFQFVARQKQPPARPGGSFFIRDPFFVKEVEKEISAVLSEKGFQMASVPRNADFLVSYYAVARNRATITPAAYHIGRYGRRWVSPGRVYRYKQGTLVIDIVDREKRELVWRGVGSGVLNRADPTRNLLLAVERVLLPFPPL